MSKTKHTWWLRSKYLITAMVLMLPPIFYYQSMNPVFPPAFSEQTVGSMKIVPMPFDPNPPYQHDGVYVKDFLLIFSEGEVGDIRQAYLNIGHQALLLSSFEQQELGILHGTRHGQHAHALASATINKNDKLWLTIQTWDGQLLQQSWDIPDYLISG